MAVILLHTIHVQGSEIGMWEYLRNSREVSTFYEDYYVDPDNTTVTFPGKKNNLIYIFNLLIKYYPNCATIMNGYIS